MGVVSFLFGTIGKSIDIVSFMLDLNFCIVNSLVRLLGVLFTFVNSLPALLLKSLQEFWRFALFCAFSASECVARAVQGALVGWQQFVGCLSESFEMARHLSGYILLRAKELLQRSALSGHCLLLHLWEAWTVAVRLILYLLDTLAHNLLIVVNLARALLATLYSGLLTITGLLWTPCQFALEFLCSLAQVFVSVFLLNAYGLALTAAIVAAATLYLNADVTRDGVRRVLRYISGVPALRRVRRALRRLYPLALERAQTVLEMGAWLQRGRGAAEGRNRQASDDTRPRAPSVQQGSQVDDGAAAGRGQRQDSAPAPPGVSKGDAAARPPGTAADSLLTLLKEQEDLKKCVICQDSGKTVLLLPCRHLCLCRDCANLLLGQPVYRHNCPLCRHMILRTIDVYV